MRLVLGIHFISESLPFSIENTGNMVSLEFRASSAHHIHHSIDSPCWITCPISEVWHGVKGTIEVARTVYQQESMFSHTAIVQSSC